MIAVVDYGMGNLRSVAKALERAGGEVLVTSDAGAVAQAGKVVLPGVGAFQDAIANLSSRGLDAAVIEAVRAGKPFLGICLGMQLLFETSYEDGVHKGLGIFAGEVVRFEPDAARADLKIPQIGWNQVGFRSSPPHLAGIPAGTFFYFVHSYYCAPKDDSVTAGETDYLCRFASAVWRDNVFACQFHPEKSQALGLQLLKNFASLT
jgi:glutamine amidotransferase